MAITNSILLAGMQLIMLLILVSFLKGIQEVVYCFWYHVPYQAKHFKKVNQGSYSMESFL